MNSEKQVSYVFYSIRREKKRSQIINLKCKTKKQSKRINIYTYVHANQQQVTIMCVGEKGKKVLLIYQGIITGNNEERIYNLYMVFMLELDERRRDMRLY